jgi:hypothetical protein
MFGLRDFDICAHIVYGLASRYQRRSAVNHSVPDPPGQMVTFMALRDEMAIQLASQGMSHERCLPSS